jgi:D-beta-D-heptose 7-phosphate kinase/D-beta-D-heptose 1-phosphate adenosyltransferase
VPDRLNHDGLDLRLPDFGQSKILVVGEAVLDRYVLGETGRISPEAPIPVLHVRGYEERPGNAAFVSANLAALGAKPSLLSVIGSDYAGRRLRKLLTGMGIETGALVQDSSRPTIVKERLMGSVQSAQRATQQLLRVDHEDTRPVRDRVELRLRRRLKEELHRVDGILVCDIGKGILTPGLLRAIIDGARECRKPVVIDPRRTDDYSIYRGATALTPNRYESERVTGLNLQTRESWELAAYRLTENYELSGCVITLDRDGLLVAESGQAAVHIQTAPREVSDVTGAGDVVIALFGLALINGFDFVRAATLANIAAGLEVTKQGAAVIPRSELLLALRESGHGSARKLAPIEQLLTDINRYRAAGKRICFIYGCFSPFRGRHIELLESAREQADLLIVGVLHNGKLCEHPDESPDLARILAGIGAVDYVVLAEDNEIADVVKRIRPDVLLLEERMDEVLSAEKFVKGNGGKLLPIGSEFQISKSYS